MNTMDYQQTSIDLSFFSVKKNDNNLNEIRNLNEQMNSMKESEVHLIKQLEDLRS